MTDHRLNFGPFTGLFVALGLLLAGIGQTAYAFDTPGQTRAARLTFVQGTVTVVEPANAASVPGQINLPLLAGVQVVTGDDGQAEVEFEDGSVARLTPNSVLSLDNLAVEPGGVFTTNLNLLRGLAYFELRATPQFLYTVYAGGDILTPVENTTVRVNFDEPPASIAVLDGTAHVERTSGPNNDSASAGYQADVRAGESLRDDATDPNRYFLTQTIAEDSWDQWNEDLDQTAAAEAADTTGVRNDYAGAQGYGWSDLDANGTWYNVPAQGPVWQPYVADDSGFDPYGYGAWVDYPVTGYVWASGYAWGWTPYRCGNWSYYNSFGWGWAPGASCGGQGWGFAGGGRPVNIGLVPVGYRPIRVPVAGHGPERPLLAVRTSVVAEPTARTEPVAGPRQIAGVTVAPIKPTGGGAVPGGAAAGSSLRRDYPVDSATHAPVLGLASTQPTVVHTTRTPSSSGVRTMTAAPATATEPAATVYPSSSGQIHPVPVERNQPYVQPAQVERGQPYNQRQAAPVEPTAQPAPRYEPTPRTEPQPAPRATTPSPARTTYSPPPAAARSNSSPPPAPSRPAAPAPSSAPSGSHGPKQ
jgi:hypothetical protein